MVDTRKAKKKKPGISKYVTGRIPMSLWKFVGKLCSFAYERLFRFSSALLIPQVHLHPDIRKLSMNQFLIFDENLVLQTSYPGKFAYKKRIKRNQVKYQSFSGGLSLTKIKDLEKSFDLQNVVKIPFFLWTTATLLFLKDRWPEGEESVERGSLFFISFFDWITEVWQKELSTKLDGNFATNWNCARRDESSFAKTVTP